MKFRVLRLADGRWQGFRDGVPVGAPVERAEAVGFIAGLAVPELLGEPGSGRTWTSSWLVAEGVETSDGRRMDIIDWRDMPLALMMQVETPDFGGHGGAEFVGVIESITKDAQGVLTATGRYTADSSGEYAARLVDEGLHGISVDVIATEVELEVTEVDEDGFPSEYVLVFPHAIVAGATITPFPAFAKATISSDAAKAAPALAASLADDCGCDEPQEIPGFTLLTDISIAYMKRQPGILRSVVASLRGAAPASAFADPKLDGPTRTVFDGDRVYGHLAAWKSCHYGILDRCQPPPKAQDGYSTFLQGSYVTAEGATVRVGCLTYGGKHAPTSESMAEAQRHYDTTSNIWAYVAVGEDAHGVWFAGVLADGIDEADMRRIRAAGVSGDWRQPPGVPYRVLTVGHSVGARGFPILEDEDGLGLVAGLGGDPELAPVTREEFDALSASVGDALSQLGYLGEDIADRIAARVG